MRLPWSVIADVYARWSQTAEEEVPRLGLNQVVLDGEELTFDTVSSWLEAYRRDPSACALSSFTLKGYSAFNYQFDAKDGSSVTIELPNDADADELMEILERAVSLADQAGPAPHVFIGYGGRSQAWRDLHDFLTGLGISVETFQSETRAGYSITEILRGMLERSNFAFLVHTAEDEVGDGHMRARQNIVHETGLFQGHLGFDRAIIVREDGTESFSNVHGLQEIRFPAGRIRTAFSAVEEVLRKHFPGVQLG